jgi:precorrin-4 methylase
LNARYLLSACNTITYSSENFFRRATYILFPGSELVSCDTVKSFEAQAKIVRSTTRQAKIKGVECFSGAREKQSTVRHLSILNFHCTLCCDLTDLSAELQQ